MADKYLKAADKQIGKFVAVTNARLKAGKIPAGTREQLYYNIEKLKKVLHNLRLLDKSLDRKLKGSEASTYHRVI